MDGKKDASCTDYNALLLVSSCQGMGTKSNCRNYNQKHYFCLRFVVSSFYTGSFQVPPEKNQPLTKVPIPTQNPNLN